MMDIIEFKIRINEIKDKLYRFAKRMLSSREEAEDAVQEVFVKLWQKMDKLDSMRNFDAYSMVVTKNLCIDRLRIKKGKIVELNDELIDNCIISPEKIIELSQIKEIINDMIDALPEKQKLVMHLRDIEGMEYHEIENIMKIDRSDVKVTLCRARKKVREKLMEIYQYERHEY